MNVGDHQKLLSDYFVIILSGKKILGTQKRGCCKLGTKLPELYVDINKAIHSSSRR